MLLLLVGACARSGFLTQAQTYPVGANFAVKVNAALTAGDPATVTVVALDGQGHLKPSYVGVVAFSADDGNAIVPPNTTFKASDLGTKILSASLSSTHAGQFSLHVLDTANPTISGGQTITVNPGPVADFQVAAAAPLNIGASPTVNVTAVDKYGNKVSNFTGSVEVHNNDPASRGSGIAVSFTPQNQGIATAVIPFAVSQPTSLTFTTTDAVHNITSSSVVPVTAGSTVSFSLITLEPATAGLAQALQLHALDKVGNIDPTYRGTVSFRSSDTAASLPANYVFSTGNGGIANVGTLTFRTVGIQNLEAHDIANSSLSGRISSLQVRTGSVTFALTTPGTPVAGVAQNLSIAAFDGQSNPVISYGGTVHFSSTDPNATLPGNIVWPLGQSSLNYPSSLTWRTASSQVLTAADVRNANNIGTANLTVRAAAVNALKISGAANTVAGSTLLLNVSAQDAYGNVNPTYLGTVQVASTDANATLPAAFAFQTTDSGTATFNALLTTASPNTRLNVTDTHVSGIGSPNFFVAVHAASAVSLSFNDLSADIPGAFPLALVVTAQDSFNNVATGYRGSVRITTDDTSAQPPADFVFSPNDAGVHPTTITYNTNGSFTINAQDLVTPAIAGSATNLHVVGLITSLFVVDAYPSPAVAGYAGSIRVSAYSTFGTPVVSYRGSVHFSSSDTAAVLPANYSFSALDNGTHVFAASLQTAGAQNITVTDLANSAVLGQQTGISVQAGPTTAFTLSGLSSPRTAGTTGSITISARDTYQNITAAYRGTVNLSSTDPNAAYPGQFVFTSGFAGISPGLSVTLKTASLNASVTATDSGSSSINGSLSGIVVVAGAPQNLTVTGYPSTSMAGAGGNITVSVRDSLNNIVTGYIGTLSFSSNDGQAVLPTNFTLSSGISAPLVASLRTAGTARNIIATEIHTPGLTGSQSSLVVLPSATSRFVVSGYASPSTAGVASSITVGARDPYNNVVSGYLGTIIFSGTDLGTTYPGAYTYGPSDLGITTQAATLVTATASGAITASEASNSNINGSQTGIRIVPASTTSLAVGSFPSPQVAGVSGSFTVAAKDSFNNTVTNYGGIISFASNDLSAVLPSNFTFSAGSFGVASGLGAVLKQAGPGHSISATDIFTPAIGGSQININILAGSANAYAVSGYTSPNTAGVASSVSVTALDVYANVVTGYRGTVRFSSNDANAVLPANYSFSGVDGGVSPVRPVTLVTANANASIRASDVVNFNITGVQSPIVIGPNSPAGLNISGFNNPAAAGIASTVSVVAWDAYLNVATSYLGTVAITSNDPLAIRPGNYTFTAPNNGVSAALSVTLRTLASNANITVTDVNNSSFRASQQNITVNAAAADHFSVSGYPAVAAANTGGNIVVTAYDSFSNVVSNYLGTVAFSSDDNQAILPVAYTFVGGDQGISKPNGIVLRTSGSRTVVAYDQQYTGLTGNQNSILITPLAAQKLSLFGIGSPTVSGVATSLNLTALDAFNNVATAYLGTVVFTGTDGQAALPSPTPFVGADNGQKTGISLTLNTAGSQTVTGTDAASPALNGNQARILVLPSAAASFSVAGYPSPTTAGIGGGVVVTAKDAHLNTVSTYLGTVSLSSSDGIASLPGPYIFTLGAAGISPSQSVVLKTASSNANITAVDLSNPNLTGNQNSILINANAAYTLLVSGFPSPALAGAGGNVVVVVQDVYGNLATGYRGTIALSSTDSNATLPGTFVFSSGNAGISAPQPVVLRRVASNANITAVGVGAPTLRGTQAPIVVTPAAAAQFVVNGFASPVVAGISSRLTVMPIDAYNNTVTGYLGTILFSSSDSNATLPANYSFVAAELGLSPNHVATLVTASPNAWLRVTDVSNGGLTGIQQPINVLSAPAASLRVAGYVSPNTAGIASSIVITAVDAFGNTAQTYQGTVALSSSDAQIGIASTYTFTAGALGISPSLTATLKTTNPAASITATDLFTGSITGSQTGITISPSFPVSLTVSGYTSPNTAGYAGSISVVAKDAYTNVSTGYLGTVNVSSNDSAATLPGNYTFLVGDLGAPAPLPVSLNTATASGSITLTDLGNPNLNGKQQGIVINAGATTHLSVAGLLSPRAAGTVGNVYLRGLDAFGNIAPTYRGTVTLTSNDPLFVSPGNYTFSPGDGGMSAGIPINLKTANSNAVLSATDIGAGSINGNQNGIVVVPAALTNFLVAGFTNPTVAGTPGTVNVTALDVYLNTFTSYRGTISFNSNDVAASLPTNFTFTAGSPGVAAGQPVTLRTARSSARIGVVDLGNASLFGGQGNILVSAAPISSFTVAGYPSPSVAGTAGNLSVTAVDPYANIATNYFGTIGFSSNDVQASLPGNFTFTLGAAGITTGQPVVLRTLNSNAVFRVTDVGNSNLTGNQNGIVINPASLTSFLVTGYASPSNAGVTSSVSVAAKDPFANNVTGYLGTLHFTSTDVVGILPTNYTYTSAQMGLSASLPITLKTANANAVIMVNQVGNANVVGNQNGIIILPAGLSKFNLAGYTNPTTAGVGSTVNVMAWDAFNNTVSAYLGTVSFSSSDGQASLPSAYTFTGTQQGVATGLAVNLKTTNPNALISVVDSGNSLIVGNQNSILVRPAAAAFFAVAGYPNPTPAGTLSAISVTAKDAFNNNATSYLGTVSFSSTDGLASLPTNFTFTLPLQATTSTPTVTLKTISANANIVVTDIGNAGLTGSQNNIIVTPAALTHFSVSGYPTPSTAGVGGSVVVTALDSFNNTVSTYQGTVLFTVNDGQAAFPATYTFAAPQVGISPAQPITLKTTNPNAVIRVADAGNPNISGNQNGIIVWPAAPLSMVITGYPTPSIAGVGGNITLSVKDAFNNNATSYLGTVIFTSPDVQASLPTNFTFTVGAAGVSASLPSVLRTLNANAVIVATDLGNGSLFGNQSGIVINPASLANYLVTGYASPSIAGVTSSVSVAARDAFANNVTGYLGTISFSSNDPISVLPTNFTYTSTQLGLTPSLPLTLKTANANAVITVNQVGGAAITGNQNAIIVLPAGLSKLKVAGYTNPTTAGAGSTVSVTAWDAFNNTVSSYLGTVSFSSSDGQASLPTAFTFTGAQQGVSGSLAANLRTTSPNALISVVDSGNSLIVGNQNSILVRPAGAAFFAVAGYPNPTPAGTLSAISVTAKDAFNNNATSYLGTVAFSSTDGLASLPTNFTFTVPLQATTSTPTVTLKTISANANITVTDIGNAGLTGSQNNIIITPAALARFSVAGYTSPSTAGVGSTVVVSAKDTFNNVVSTYQGTVLFTVNDVQAIFPTTYTFTAPQVGISTAQAITLKTTNPNAVIRVADAGNPNISGNQNGIIVWPAAPASMVIAGYPTPSVAGVGGSITLSIKDAFNNIATSYLGTVTFTSPDVQATLPTNYTFTVGAAGVSSGLPSVLRTLNANAVITATDVTNSGLFGNQSGIVINPASLATYVVTGYASPSIAGVPSSVSVAARDAFANTVTGYLGTVSFSSNDPISVLPTNFTYTSTQLGITPSLPLTLKTANANAVITVNQVGSAGITGNQNAIIILPADLSKLKVAGYANPTTAGVGSTVSVTAWDAFNNTVSSYLGTVSFSSSDGQASLPTAFTFTGVQQGVSGALSVNLRTTSPNALISVVDSGNSLIVGNQNSILVRPAGAAFFAVNGYPNPTPAGTLSAISITAKDAFNNTATSYLGTVAFTSNDVLASLPTNFTFTVPLQATTSTPTVTLKTISANANIIVTDIGNAGLTGSQNNIIITPAALSRFTVAGYTSPSTAGVGSTVIVSAKDTFNNVVSTYQGTILFTVNDVQAVFPATYTFTAPQVGISPAQAITLKTTNPNAVIRVADAGNPNISGNQNGIIVWPAAPVSMIIAGYPTPSIAGVGGNITLSVKDAFNNNATSYLGTVIFTSPDVQATLPTNYTFTVGAAGVSSSLPSVLRTLNANAVIVATDLGNGSLFGNQSGIVINPAGLANYLVTGYASPSIAGVTSSINVTARDAFANTVTGYLGTVSFSSNDPISVLPTNFTYTSTQLGLASSLPLTLKTANANAVITVNQVGGTAITGNQNAIIVLPAGLSKLKVAGYANPTTAGAGSTVTVTAWDAFNNTVSSYLGTVSFSSSDGQATLPTAFTFTGAQQGVSTALAANLKTTNPNALISVVDSGNSLIVGNQNSILVRPAGAAFFAVNGYPNPTPAGTLSAISITAKDAFNNTATSYLGTVAFTSNDGLASLPTNFTFTVPLQATTSTPTVTLKTISANANIIVTDIGNAGLTGSQNNIIITPAALSRFSVVGYTNPSTAGVGSTVVVSAKDTFNNVVSTYQGTVLFTVNDVQAIFPATYTFTAPQVGISPAQAITLKTTNPNAVIRVADAGNPNISGNQNGIIVWPAAAASMVIAGYPTPSIAGVGGSITLSVKDAFNNNATGYLGTVIFTSPDSQASLPTNFTFTVGAAGVSSSLPSVLRTLNANAVITATDLANGSLFGNQSGIVINPASLASYLVTGYASPSVAGVTSSINVTARDAFANTVTGYLGTVSFSSNDPISVLPTNFTYTSAQLGLASSLPLTLKTANANAVITVNQVGDTAITGNQNAIIVLPAGLSKLKVAGYANPTTAGAGSTVTVTAWDAFNNTVSSYLGTVSFSSSDGQATLPTAFTFTGAQQGVSGSLPANLKTTSPNALISVVDSGNSLIVGNQNSILVRPAGAAFFAVNGYPNPTPAGTLSAISITAKDAFNNTATSYLGTVAFTSNDGLASLPTNFTFTVPLQATTSTPTVTLKTISANANITVTDIGNAGLTGSQNNIIITPAALSRFSVVGYTNPSTAGVGSTVVVSAKDTFNNVVSTYQGTVLFTVNDVQAIFPATYTFTAPQVGISPAQAITLKTTNPNAVIRVADAGNPNISGNQNGIIVWPAAPVGFTVSGYPNPATAGVSSSVSITAQDAFSNTATSYLGTLVFSSTDASATLPTNFTFTVGMLGTTAAPSVTLKTAASNANIIVTDFGTPGLTGSQNNILVLPNTPNRLIVSGYPSPSIAGVGASIGVTVRDNFNNTITGYRGTISLTSNDPQASGTPVNYTFGAPQAGVATGFAVTLKTANANAILTATDVNVGTLNGTQAQIRIQSASPNLLIVSGYPNPAVAGSGGNLSVVVRDAFTNVATTYFGTVHITSNDPLSILPTDFSFNAGVSPLQNANLITAQFGTYLTATDVLTSALTGSESNIAVNASAVAKLKVSGFPSPILAGTSANTLSVVAQDIYQNTATTYIGSVAFSSSDLQAIMPSGYSFTAGNLGVSPNQTITLATASLTANITATDASNGNITGNQNFIVVNSNPNAIQLLISGYPCPSTAGTLAPTYVYVSDIWGNSATNYVGTIAFTSNDVQAVLPTNLAMTAGMVGYSGAQNVTLKTATTSGTITVTDTLTATLTGNQNNLVVWPAPAASLVIAGYPTPSAAGAGGNIVVTAKDVYANIATSYLGTVSFTSNDGLASLPANFTFLLGSGGVSASLSSNLRTLNANAFIQATDVVTSSLFGDQHGIQITPAPASFYVVTGYASPSIAGIASSLNLVVKDTFANTVTGYLGTVSFSSNDPIAALPTNFTYTPGLLGVASGIGATLRTANANAVIVATQVGVTTVTGNQNGIIILPASLSKFKVAGYASPSIAGTPSTVTVTAWDAFNNTVSGYLGTVGFTSNDVLATLPTAYTFTGAQQGVSAALSATLKVTNANAVISAADSGNSLIVGNQNSIVIRPTVAATFAVSGYPSPVTAGVANAFTVVAKDVYSNTATGYLGTVSFASNDVLATLPTNFTFTTGLLGIASTPSVTLKTTTANANIIVTDVVSASLTGSQNNIIVTPAAFARYTVAGYASPSTAGVGSTVTVTAKDTFNNTVSTYLGTVLFSTNDAQATFPANFTFTAPQAGISAAQSINLKTTNANAVIQARDFGNPNLTGNQNGIVIWPAPIASFAVSGYPGTVTAGAPATLSISAKDSFNNTATSYLGTIGFSSNDVLAVYPASFTFTVGLAGTTATPSVTLKTAATNANIIITDVGNTGLTGSQNNIIVLPSAASRFIVSGYTSPSVAGVASAVNVLVKDLYSNTVSGYRGTVTLTSNDVQAGGIPANYTFGAPQAGLSAALAVNLKTANANATITATDVSSGAINGTQALIIIGSANANYLVASAYPTPTYAGAGGNLSIVARDAFTNLATTYFGTVHLTSNDGIAYLPADFSMAAGVAPALNPNLVTAQTTAYLRGTDIGNANITGSQNNISVNASLAAQFTVSGFPNPAVAGVSYSSLSVRARDIYTNLATTYLGSVAFSSTDLQATLPSTYSFTIGNLGVSPNQTITLATTSTTTSIAATDAGNGNITGNQNFIVVNANPNVTQFLVSGYPCPTVAGTMAPIYTYAADLWGNNATTYVGTIAYSSNDNQAILPVNLPMTAGMVGFSGAQNVTMKTATTAGIVSVNDINLPTLTGNQNNLVVNPNAVTRLSVGGYPCPAIINTGGNIMVQALDAYDNTATDYLGTVQFSSNDPNAILPTNFTFLPGSAAASPLLFANLRSVGTTLYIAAADVANPNLNGNQNSLRVTLTLVAPGNNLVRRGRLPGSSANQPQVYSLFDGSNDWTTYVEDTDGLRSLSEPCLLVDGIPAPSCLHAPEYNVVDVPGFTRCGSLQARDSLDAFNWHCDDRTGRVRMVSVGLKPRRRLSDLIDWRHQQWRANYVIVEREDVRVLRTEPKAWFDPQQLRALPDYEATADGPRLVLDQAGIYLAGAAALPSALQEIVVQSDHVTLLTAPHQQLRGASGSAAVRIEGRDFTWVEGALVNLGLQLTDARYATVRHLSTDRDAAAQGPLAIRIQNGERLELQHIEIVAQPAEATQAYGLWLDMNRSQLRDVAFLGPYSPFISLTGTANRLMDVWVPEPEDFSYYSDGESTNNFIVNLPKSVNGPSPTAP